MIPGDLNGDICFNEVPWISGDNGVGIIFIELKVVHALEEGWFEILRVVVCGWWRL